MLIYIERGDYMSKFLKIILSFFVAIVALSVISFVFKLALFTLIFTVKAVVAITIGFIAFRFISKIVDKVKTK